MSYVNAALAARMEWKTLFPADENNVYLMDKYLSHWVKSFNIRENMNGDLFIPMYVKGKFMNLQRIWYSEEGEFQKRFIHGGQVSGGYHIIQPFNSNPDPVIIAEGWATAATIAMVTNKSVVCAFMVNNMRAVARYFAESLRFIAADNDWYKNNTGLKEAEKIHKEFSHMDIKMSPCVDSFPNWTDWNDIYKNVEIADVILQRTFR